MSRLCENPYVKGSQAYPCGKCDPCLRVRRKTWVHRIGLESNLKKDNCFITLTYSDEHLPKGGSLAPEEIRDWLKRFRKAITPVRIRYYLVGEYGDVSQRPHYHAAIFGYPTCVYGLSRYSRERKDCCPVCDTVRDTWGRGNVYVGSLEAKSANYIAGYVTKKMTHRHHPALKGREPEFSRMSLRPGIGADFMWDVASELMKLDGTPHEQGDVPVTLRHGGRQMPLGRYLRRKTREYMGRPVTAPETPLDPEVQALWDAAVQASANLKVSGLRDTIYKNSLIDAGDQRRINAKAREDIFKGRKIL